MRHNETPLSAKRRHSHCRKIAEKRDERAPFHRPTLMGITDKLEQRVSGKAHKNHIRVPRLAILIGGNGAPVCEFHN
jgi:hypothetical protein